MTRRDRRIHRSAEPKPLPGGPPLAAIHRLLLILSLALAALLAVRRLGSPDIGFHLRTGEYILGGHGWPRTDPFTETMKGHPYVDTSWGFDVLAALLFRLGGPAGPIVLTAVLVLAILALLLLTARLEPADPATLGLLLAASAIACEMRYEPRPEMLSYSCLALLLYVLRRHSGGRRTPLWILPLLMLAWSNTHSLFVLGWAVLACFILGGALRDRKVDGPLLRWSSLSVAVAVLNPYGVRGVAFPFTLLTRFQKGNAFAGSIGEFVSPFTLAFSSKFPFYPRLPVWTCCAMALLSLPAAAVALRRRRYSDLLLWLVFLPLSARMIRNVPLFVIATFPMLAAGLPAAAALSRVAGERIAARAAAALVAAAGAFCLILGLRVVHDAYYVESRRAERFGLSWNRFELPVDAAAFAERARLPGGMLNHLNFGGYLMWAQRRPVFIDGRLEVVGESFFQEYQRAMGSDAALEQLVSRYGLRWVIFPYSTNDRLLRSLSRDPRWDLAYVDNLAAIFVRRGPSSDAWRDPALVAAPAGADSSGSPTVHSSAPDTTLPGLGGGRRPGAFERWWRGLVSREEFPMDDFYVGLFWYLRGDLDRAQPRFEAAIRKSDGLYFEPYLNLGSVLYRKKEFAVAARAYRAVLEDRPDNALARDRLEAMGQRP